MVTERAGYDTGYISSVLVTLGDALGHTLSSSEQELVTSLTSGGALVGAVFAGLIADRFGRKWPIWAACIVFVIGTILQLPLSRSLSLRLDASSSGSESARLP